MKARFHYVERQNKPKANHRKILVKTSTENAREHLASGENFIMDRIGDARIFGAARAENKSKNLFFAESRQK